MKWFATSWRSMASPMPSSSTICPAAEEFRRCRSPAPPLPRRVAGMPGSVCGRGWPMSSPGIAGFGPDFAGREWIASPSVLLYHPLSQSWAATPKDRERRNLTAKDELYRRLFRTSLLIRLVEERIIDLYPSDRIQSPVHLSIGQEAVAVGVCDALRPDDLVFATYRSHGFYIAKGGRLDEMFAELYGRMDGISKGKAGSMHLSAPAVGLMGSSAVVASTTRNTVGAALSFKRRGEAKIALPGFAAGR